MREIFRDLAAYVSRSWWHAYGVLGFFVLFSLYFMPATLMALALLAFLLQSGGRLMHLGMIVIMLASAAVGASFIPGRPGLELPLVVMLTPVVAVAAIRLRDGGLGQALAVMTGMLASGVIILEWVSGNAMQFWQGWLERAIKGVPGAGLQGFEDDGTLMIMSGLVATLLGMISFGSLLLGCWMRRILDGRPDFAALYQAMTLPLAGNLILPLLIVAVGFWKSEVQKDLMVLLSFPYAFLGLAVLHMVVDRARWPWFLAVPPYMGIALFPVATMVMMATLGACDTLLHLRKKLSSLGE